MRWIPNVKQVALQSYSQVAQMLAVTILTAYGAMPDKLQDALPVWAVMGIAIFVLLLGIIGRLVYQPGLHKPAPPQDPDTRGPG